MKNGLLCLIVLCAAFAEAREINVADHGVVPGKDVTYPLNQLIQSMRKESAITLVFPQGQYDFYPENAVEMHRAVSNHDNGLKRIAFPLLALASLLAHLQRLRAPAFALVLGSTLVLTLAGNVLRVSLLALGMVHLSPAEAEGAFHAYSGMLLFLVNLVGLMALSRWLLRGGKASK